MTDEPPDANLPREQDFRLADTLYVLAIVAAVVLAAGIVWLLVALAR